MTDLNKTGEIILLPNEIWSMILDYLHISELQTKLEKEKQMFDNQKYAIEESLSDILSSTKRLRKIQRKIDNCTSFLDYSGGFKKVVSDLDGYSMDLREEIYQLHKIINNVRSNS